MHTHKHSFSDPKVSNFNMKWFLRRSTDNMTLLNTRNHPFLRIGGDVIKTIQQVSILHKKKIVMTFLGNSLQPFTRNCADKNRPKTPKMLEELHKVFCWRRKTLKIIRKSYRRITIRKKNRRITIRSSLETEDLNNDEQLHWNRVPDTIRAVTQKCDFPY